VVARDGDRGKHPWSKGSSHDGRQPLAHRARSDTCFNRASSSTRWGFCPCWWLPSLASCDDSSRHLMVDVGFSLLRVRWRHHRCWTNYRSSPSLHQKMAWWLVSVPLGERAWNTMLSVRRSRLSNRNIWLGHTLFHPAPSIPLTSDGCWRSAKSSFPYRRWTWRCERQS
jgi:hypothetical protein